MIDRGKDCPFNARINTHYAGTSVTPCIPVYLEIQYFYLIIPCFLKIPTILSRAGHIVELRPFKDWNVVEIWVNGEKIFNCDIRNLDYGKIKICSIFILHLCLKY